MTMELQSALQSLSGTSLDAPAAANVWAATTGLDLPKALNVRAGTTGMDLDGVCNLLAGTSGLSAQAALSLIATSIGSGTILMEDDSSLLLENGFDLQLES